MTHVIDNVDRWRSNFRGLEFRPVNFVKFVHALVNDTHARADINRTAFGTA